MDERLAWLRLCSANGVGSVNQRRLLQAFGTPEAIFSASVGSLHGVIGALAESLYAAESAALAENALRWLDQPGASLLTLADPQYPSKLLALPDPPTVLFVLGNPALLSSRSLAVVGSRSATLGGESTASRFAEDLARRGFCIVSGMALGIDGAAHRGALKGGGATVAVVGTGADRIYPARHRDLAHAIAAQGALISEFLPGTPPQAANFPRRNRLIAALADGVLVVEAATESGSLITARLAGDLGREVFAVPGSIHSPQSRGCHRLIREGAKLVETTQDILDELQAFGRDNKSVDAQQEAAPAHSLSTEAAFTLEGLGGDPCTLDLLCERCGLPSETLLATLLELELSGLIAALPGGRYQRLE